MKLVIIGGVAGGASAAARARRVDESAEIVLLERGEYISFANCGLPYYISGEIEEREDLLVTTPEKLRDRFRVDVRIWHQCLSIDRDKKQIKVMDHSSKESYTENYDKLILSPGAEPIKPDMPGIDLPGIYTLRTVPDTDCIKLGLEKMDKGSVVIVGGGFIGLEMAESAAMLGHQVSIVEMLEQVMPPMDFEMAAIIHEHLREKGVDLRCGDGVKSFEKEDGRIKVTSQSGCEFMADAVILSIGVRPENRLAQEAGLEIGDTGGILVDQTLRTSDPDIFAVGDAIQVKEFVTGDNVRIPLAGPANKQGRIAANNALGRKQIYKGVVGTSVVRVFDLTAASTGASEKLLKKSGRPYRASYTHSMSHASYFPGAERISLKLVFDPDDGTVLGAQAVGKDGVDKRIDVLATAVRAKMTVFDLEELDLAYAPPYGSAKDPVNMAGFVASNIMKGDVEAVTWDQMDDFDSERFVLLDVRDEDEAKEEGMVEGALIIPINDLRDRLAELDRDKTYLCFCTISLRAYIAHRILRHHGISSKIISGGHITFSKARRERESVKCVIK